jgi:hypothetical protein
MMGKKIALVLLDIASMAGRLCLPKTEEENTEENGQNANTNCLGLLENLHNAVQKGGDPEEPFEQSSYHESTNDGNINDLKVSVLRNHYEQASYSHP